MKITRSDERLSVSPRIARVKIVLAGFGFGGGPLPGFPRFAMDGTRHSRAAWLLKERSLPPVHWKGMPRGREWMAKPRSNAGTAK